MLSRAGTLQRFESGAWRTKIVQARRRMKLEQVAANHMIVVYRLAVTFKKEDRENSGMRGQPALAGRRGRLSAGYQPAPQLVA